MRFKVFLASLLLLLLNTGVLYAQISLPCEGNDVDSTCPLDTWVIILAVIAVVFATIHLYRKNLSQRNSSSSN
jgi:hypothetical protein